MHDPHPHHSRNYRFHLLHCAFFPDFVSSRKIKQIAMPDLLADAMKDAAVVAFGDDAALASSGTIALVRVVGYA